MLECRGGASIGFIVGSVTNLGCVLRVEGMPEDRYIATIRKVGLDLGITQESALAWGVFAPVARLGPGDLSGNYAGAQGSASLGVGVGGNVLVGGSTNSIALQPLSVQGQVGVNIAAGLESLELRPDAVRDAGQNILILRRPLASWSRCCRGYRCRSPAMATSMSSASPAHCGSCSIRVQADQIIERL